MLETGIPAPFSCVSGLPLQLGQDLIVRATKRLEEPPTELHVAFHGQAVQEDAMASQSKASCAAGTSLDSGSPRKRRAPTLRKSFVAHHFFDTNFERRSPYKEAIQIDPTMSAMP